MRRSFDRSAPTDFDVLVSRDAPKHRSKNHDRLRRDVGTDRGIGSDGKCVIGQVDASVHLAVNGQILGAGDFAFDANRSPELRCLQFGVVAGLGFGSC